MNLSRKDFMRRGFMSLGRVLLNPAGFRDDGQAEMQRLRPPGFCEGKRTACRECEACMNACPKGVLGNVEGMAEPVFEPTRGSCAFCYLCVGACPHGVLAFPEQGTMARLGLAVPDNGQCLARQGGCFTCLERCPQGAIAIEPGKGIRVDAESCNGCGGCEHVCPMAPVAIRVNHL